jgi:defect-in-organelle-trafficking protein DotD
MSVRILIIIALFVISSGCARRFVPPPASNVISSLPYALNADDAEVKIAESAVSVSNSLINLAEIEKAAHPCFCVIPPPIDAERFGLACPASVDWVGPVEPLLRKIADATCYRLRVIGREPAIPVIVSISSKQTPFADILRNISLQVHKKANVVLYPRSRVIELRYCV